MARCDAAGAQTAFQTPWVDAHSNSNKRVPRTAASSSTAMAMTGKESTGRPSTDSTSTAGQETKQKQGQTVINSV